MAIPTKVGIICHRVKVSLVRPSVFSARSQNDMPPFTLYGSSANQTESITKVYTYSNKTTRTHTQKRERKSEGGGEAGERMKGDKNRGR